jgi:predicted site-specific integrase-resolvase
VEKQFVRPTQLAKMFGVSTRTLRNWMVMGVIPFRRIKRVILFDPVEAKTALDRFRTEAK